eukprot:s312_g11.t3
MEQHRTERCSRRNYLCPIFAEFFPEAGQPLTEAMALNRVAVLPAFGPNVNSGDDFWSPAGKDKMERIEADPLVAAKFWTPPFSTFGRGARRASPPQQRPLGGGAPAPPAEAAAEIIAPLAQEILEDPQGHLRKMLSRGHYRGTEVRLMAPGEPDNLKMVPYPAHLWRWRNTLSFAWQNEDNITTLEMLAALAEIRRRARQLGTQGTRFFHVLDSQVKYHIMAKERAHSKRLNRLARRMMAVQLGGQLQALALWTISALNFADTASRRFAPHHGS